MRPVARLDELLDPLDDPAIVAHGEDGTLSGVLTYRVAGRACEVTTLYTDVPGRGTGTTSWRPSKPSSVTRTASGCGSSRPTTTSTRCATTSGAGSGSPRSTRAPSTAAREPEARHPAARRSRRPDPRRARPREGALTGRPSLVRRIPAPIYATIGSCVPSSSSPTRETPFPAATSRLSPVAPRRWATTPSSSRDHLIAQLSPVPAMADDRGRDRRPCGSATFVLNNDLRHPAVLAQDLASLDVLPAGGSTSRSAPAGTGPSTTRSACRSTRSATRVARLAESVAVLKGCFARRAVQLRRRALHDHRLRRPSPSPSSGRIRRS